MKRRPAGFYLIIITCIMTCALLIGCAEDSRSQIQHVERGEGASSSEQTGKQDGEQAAGKEAPDVKKGLIGIVMPEQGDERAVKDGETIRGNLREAGYAVKLLYAAGSTANQISQIEDLIRGGCSLLIVQPVEGATLGGALAKAKRAGIPVIGYGGPIGSSQDVTCYVFADDYEAGKMQAAYILDKLKEKGTEEVWRLEVFSGAPGDKRAMDFYNGLMEVLNPYLSSGRAAVHSGKTSFSQTAVASRSGELARARMENLLGSYYADGTPLDAVLCAGDGMAVGVMKALDTIYSGEWPLIAGQGFYAENAQEIADKRQTLSVYFDSAELGAGAAELAVSLLEGEKLPEERFFYYEDGGVKTPVLKCAPRTADGDNLKELLKDSGYEGAGIG